MVVIKKYRETSSRFSPCCFVINVCIFVPDKTGGFGWRHFILKARFLHFWRAGRTMNKAHAKKIRHICAVFPLPIFLAAPGLRTPGNWETKPPLGNRIFLSVVTLSWKSSQEQVFLNRIKNKCQSCGPVSKKEIAESWYLRSESF